MTFFYIVYSSQCIITICNFYFFFIDKCSDIHIPRQLLVPTGKAVQMNLPTPCRVGIYSVSAVRCFSFIWFVHRLSNHDLQHPIFFIDLCSNIHILRQILMPTKIPDNRVHLFRCLYLSIELLILSFLAYLQSCFIVSML